MAVPTTVTLKISDNPMAGVPGQPDYTITISAEPDIPYDGTLADPDDMPMSVLAATKCLAELAGISMEVAFHQVASGGEN